MNWMIYGATGYTGQLVVADALARGHQPVLAGRNVDKLQALADETGLPFVAFHLDDVATIGEAIADMDLVYHAAGPFIRTSEPMLRACLATGTHYLDITGEIPVFEQTFDHDEVARRNGIALISGVGFDVVPTDCLGLYVAQQVRNPTHLEIALAGFEGISAGTAKSMIGMMPAGGYSRRDGELQTGGFASDTRRVQFSNGRTYDTASLPWGDLSTAYRSTSIPNITTYITLPRATIVATRLVNPVASVLLRSSAIRSAAEGLAERLMRGPSQTARETTRTYVWAQARNEMGEAAEAWLETREAYAFTAEAGVLAVERTLELHPIGALSPAQAFGADFVLEVSQTTRHDAL